MENEKISIIIPMYNAENNIGQCLTSIIRQTYKYLEIIIVDDGSNDRSVEICETYMQMDNRITLYKQQNSGVCKARNLGLLVASGDYIQFIDADDYIADVMCEHMVGDMKQANSDLVICDYFSIKPEKTTHHREKIDGIMEIGQFVRFFEKDPGSYYYGVVWNKLYRAKTIKENHLTFDDSLSLGEDFVFNLSYLLHCNMICILGSAYYFYNELENNSLARCEKTIECRTQERLVLFERYLLFLKDYDCGKELINANFYILKHVAAEYYTILYRDKEKSWKQKRQLLGYIRTKCLTSYNLNNIRTRIWVRLAAFKYNYCSFIRIKYIGIRK